jgi:hypothetical protein
MPAITERATRRLVEARRRRGLPETYTPRLSRRAGKLVLDFATSPAVDDLVSMEGGLTLFVSPAVGKDLDDVVVDVDEKDGAQRLILMRDRSRRS